MSMFTSQSARYCRPCQKDVVAAPRARFAGTGLVLVSLLTLVLIAFSSLIGPFIMFMAPVILLAGFAIGPLVSLITAPETCPECARELPFRTRKEATHRENARESIVRRANTGPRVSPASDMKAA